MNCRADEAAAAGEDDLGFLHGMNINHLVRNMSLLSNIKSKFDTFCRRR